MRRAPFAPKLLIVTVGILWVPTGGMTRAQACVIHEPQKLTASDGAQQDYFCRFLSVNSPPAQGVVHVDMDAGGPAHDGSSWCSPYPDLEDAPDVGISRDEIQAPGDASAAERVCRGCRACRPFSWRDARCEHARWLMRPPFS